MSITEKSTEPVTTRLTVFWVSSPNSEKAIFRKIPP